MAKTNTKHLHSLADRYDLDALDMKILKHVVENPTNIDTKFLSEICDVDPTTVNRRIKKKNFMLARQQIEGTTDDIIIESANLGAKKIRELINHKNPRVALDASKAAVAMYAAKSAQGLDLTNMPALPSLQEARRIIAQDPILSQDPPKTNPTVEIINVEPENAENESTAPQARTKEEEEHVNSSDLRTLKAAN